MLYRRWQEFSQPGQALRTFRLINPKLLNSLDEEKKCSRETHRDTQRHTPWDAEHDSLILSPAVELLRVLLSHQVEAVGDGGVLWGKQRVMSLGRQQLGPHILFLPDHARPMWRQIKKANQAAQIMLSSEWSNTNLETYQTETAHYIFFKCHPPSIYQTTTSRSTTYMGFRHWNAFTYY